MAGALRLLIGIALLPACWGVTEAFMDSVVLAAGVDDWLGAETLSLLFGMAAFVLAWLALPHPVRTYVFGHELTHALWGLLFGAVPSDVRVDASGGSVRLSKSNFIITLAPYFFPFYTFVVIVAALVTYAFVRPLPALPLWMALIGFTWAFHVLFTLETLTQRQPDVRLYGRIFSWAFIYLANVALVLLWLVATTRLTFPQLGDCLAGRLGTVYVTVVSALWGAGRWCLSQVRDWR